MTSGGRKCRWERVCLVAWTITSERSRLTFLFSMPHLCVMGDGIVGSCGKSAQPLEMVYQTKYLAVSPVMDNYEQLGPELFGRSLSSQFHNKNLMGKLGLQWMKLDRLYPSLVSQFDENVGSDSQTFIFQSQMLFIKVRENIALRKICQNSTCEISM